MIGSPFTRWTPGFVDVDRRTFSVRDGGFCAVSDGLISVGEREDALLAQGGEAS